MLSDVTFKSQKFDYGALLLSGTCLAHCLLLPVVVLLFPMIGQWLGLHGHHHHLHLILFILALPVSVLGLYQGYRQHQVKQVVWWALIGFSLMAIGLLQSLLVLQVLFTVSGVTLVATAHILNLRRCSLCQQSIK